MYFLQKSSKIIFNHCIKKKKYESKNILNNKEEKNIIFDNLLNNSVQLFLFACWI